ncbi:chemokine XC receptor 1-like [Stigmatopora argus]
MVPSEEATSTPNTTTAWTDNIYSDEYSDEYSDDYEDEICHASSLLNFAKLSSPIFLSVVTVLSFLGNILVLVIVLKYENVKSLTNALILNLAVSDLLFAAALPFWARYYAWGWSLGENACRMVSFVFNVGFYSSGLFLIAMTAQRYAAVLRPMSGLVSAGGCYSLLASALVWSASVSVAVPAAVLTDVAEHHNKSYCEFTDLESSLWAIYQQNVLFLLISCVFLFCYSQILCRLFRPMARRRKHKTLRLIFTLVVLFFVGWAPYNVALFLKSLQFWPQTATDSATRDESCANYKLLELTFHVSRLLAYSHCCVNPIFYVFVGSKFKCHLIKMMGCRRGGDGAGGVPRGRRMFTSLSSGDDLCV